MLNRHPRLAVPFESGFIPEFAAILDRYGDLAERSGAARLLADIQQHPKVAKGRLVENPEAVLARPIAGYAELVNAIFSEWATRRGKVRWGDKTPAYLTEIDRLWRLFPGCRILHLVRDGRDVALSLRRVRWGSRNIVRLAADWQWKTTVAHKIGGVLGSHYQEVRYEDLVMDPEGTLRVVCTFLGERYDPAMLSYEGSAVDEMPEDSLQWHANSVRSPDAALIGRWRRDLSRADRVIFEDIAGAALELFGYELERRPATWASRLKRLYYCAVRPY
jgi:hypothetical protein